MHLIVKSLERPDICYLVDGLRYYEESTRKRGAVEWAREYKMLGDGEHTPAFPISNQHLADFCASLGVFLIAEPLRTEEITKLFPLSRAYKPDIRFYMTLKCKEGKKVYFEPWMDGNNKAIFHLVVGVNHYDDLTKFLIMQEISEISEEYISLEKFFNLPEHTECAVRILKSIMEAFTKMSWAHNYLDAYRHYIDAYPTHRNLPQEQTPQEKVT